jgi:hypothetical protein
MNKVRFVLAVVLAWGFLSIASAETYTPGQKVNKDFDSFARPFLVSYCVDCHGETEPEGNLSLHNLGPVDEVNSGTWRSVWAQVTLKEMPPSDAERPKIVERLQFSDWIVGELTRVMRDKGGFRAHLDPNKGNFVDHDLLFGPLPDGIKLDPTSSPTRIWRVTPGEHITRLNELINREPEYDSAKPGLRTRGDVVPTNHGGELKLYFGTDRIIQWQGGTVAYATSVKSVPCGQKSQPSFKHLEKQVSRHAPGSHLSRHHVHILSCKGCLIVNLGTAPDSSGTEFGHAALLVREFQ